jgi:type IV secretory pathway VirB10-like protein
MSRNRFRSQPTLQRSGGGGGFGALIGGFVVLAGAGAIGAYGLSHFSDRGPAPVAEAPAISEVDATLAQTDAAAPLPAGPMAPVAAAPAPPIVVAAVEPQSVRPVAVREKKPVKRRSAGPQYPLAASAEDAAVVATAREKQQRDYASAMEKYEKAERDEGFRWAKENRIRVARYCRTTGRRTDAFMKGCLAFVSRSAKGPDEGGSRASPALQANEG